jgi:hypothetical protein
MGGQFNCSMEIMPGLESLKKHARKEYGTGANITCPYFDSILDFQLIH